MAQKTKINFIKLKGFFGSFGYKRFLYEWSDRVLDTLETIDMLTGEEATGRIDDHVAELLFNYGVLTLGYIKDNEVYGKGKEFSRFYEEFKKTGLYKDMIEVRELKKSKK